jgi:hypothetical protein
MSRRWLILLPALVSLSAAPAPIDSNGPATHPTTRPSLAPRPRQSAPASAVVAPVPPMPRDYSIFNYRSLFMRGRVPAAGRDAGRSRESSSSSDRTVDGFRTPEEAFIFNGVTQTDEGAEAFIENLSTKKVSLVRVGQSIATGKITGISIHTLQYTAGGKSIRIEIGQNLAGVVAEPSTAVSATSATQPADAPPGTPGASPPIPGGTEDILERLRKRREAELGGK